MSERETLRPVPASRQRELDEVLRDYSNALERDDDVLEYLEERGLTEATRRTARLGVVDDPHPGHEAMHGMLAIPYLDRKGRPLTIRFRRHPAREDGPKYRSISGDLGRLYNIRAFHEGGTTLSIAEGECLRGDAEVLTRAGWVRFDQYRPGTEVAQYGMNGELEFVRPLAHIEKEFDGELIEYSNRWRYYSLTTPGHRMPAFGGKGDPYRFVTAEEGSSYLSIPRAGVLNGDGIPLLDDEIRLLIAISADATIDTRGSGAQYVRFGFKRERKMERLRKIAANLGVEISDNPVTNGYQSICFRVPEHLFAQKRMPWAWITEATSRQREMIIEELRQWDGNGVPGRNQEEFSSKLLENAEWVQAMAHTSGRTSTIMERSNAYGTWYKVSILHGKRSTGWQALRKNKRRVPHKGKVYCVKVPSGAFIVRMGGCVSITGNCDALILNQVGIKAVALPGCTAWKYSYAKAMAGYDRVWVWGDGDQGGAEMVQTVTRQLHQAKGVRVPKGMDVTDIYLQGGAEALYELINEED